MIAERSSVNATAQIGHNGGPDMEAERLYQLIGPKPSEPVYAFDCGAPWTAYATEKELKELGRVHGWIIRAEARIKMLRTRRTRIMMRCIRRMRRDLGKE